MTAAPDPANVVLAGVHGHGHGRWHLRNLDWLRRAGAPVRLAGICDTRPPHAATDLLENLVAHVRGPDVPLLVPLAATRPFMRVVEAVRLAPEPAEIPAGRRRTDTSGPYPRVVVPGVDAAVVRAAGDLALLSELDLLWAGQDRQVAGG
jgi:hypothetical protein